MIKSALLRRHTYKEVDKNIDIPNSGFKDILDRYKSDVTTG